MNCHDAVRGPLLMLNSWGCGARRRRLIACAALRPCHHRHGAVICNAVHAAEAHVDKPHDGNLEYAHGLIQPLMSMRSYDAVDLAAYATLRDGDLLWADLIEILINAWNPTGYRELRSLIDDFSMPDFVAERWDRRLPPPYGESARPPATLAGSLAVAAYEKRGEDGTLENDRLAVLADALEDDGFSHQATLDHLRKPGRHFMGCWAVDWLLGKEK